jgi:hypothetical protein
MMGALIGGVFGRLPARTSAEGEVTKLPAPAGFKAPIVVAVGLGALPEKDEAFGTLVGLQDLVGDPSQGPGYVCFMKHGARAHPRSLLRLTGRG